MNSCFLKKSFIVLFMVSGPFFFKADLSAEALAKVGEKKKAEVIIPPTPLESLLLAHAYPGMLDVINEEGVKEPNTLGRALGCCAQQPLAEGEKLLDGGGVENCSLLDAVARQLTKDMPLALGKAAFARESVVLKSRASLAQRQELLKALTPELCEELKKHLHDAAQSEEGFLDLLSQKKINNPTNFDISLYIEMVIESVLPAALMYFRVHDNEKDPQKIRDGMNRFKAWVYCATAGYLCRLGRPLFNKLNKYGKKVVLPALRKHPKLATAVMHGTTVVATTAPFLNFYINHSFNSADREAESCGYQKDDFFRSTFMHIYLQHLWNILGTYKWVIEPEYVRMTQLVKIRNRLVDVAAFVRASESSYKAFALQGLAEKLPDREYALLESFFGKNRSASYADLTGLCSTQTFDSRKGFPWMWGRIGRLIDIIKRHKKELRELAAAVGYLDYMVHMSQLVNKKDSEVKWSYTNFVETETPQMNAEQVWYPGISLADVVTTSVDLGHKTTGNILITGVNGSGKSIVMSAVMLTAVCGQTHGIVPAARAHCSYFEHLFFHGNLADVKGGGLSKGINEMKNAITIIKSVKEQPGKVLVMFDELFSSTDAESAELLASLVIKNLIVHKNVMLVATTHNPGLRERLTAGAQYHSFGDQGTIENAVVETNVTPSGDVEYKRQLVVPGINRDKPALYIMRNKLKDAGVYDDEMAALMDDAIEKQKMNMIIS